jgi:hypothetical protein
MGELDTHLARHHEALSKRGYDQAHYTEHYACFACRRAFKHREEAVIGVGHEYPPRPPRYRPCPECGGPARSMGKNFKAPRRESANQWRKLELLARLDMLFHGPGRRPRTYAEARQLARREGHG